VSFNPNGPQSLLAPTQAFGEGSFDPRNYGDYAEYGDPDLNEQHLWAHRTPMWHRAGMVVQEQTELSKAIADSGNDYEVYARPATVELNGNWVETDKFQAIVRGPLSSDPQEVLFGFSTDHFVPLQNAEIGRQLVELSREWPTATVGSLGKGERFFFTLRAGEDLVKGERVISYFAGIDSKLPGGALTLAYTPIRFECANTVRIGLSLATVQVSIRHTRGVHDRFVAYADLMAKMKGARVESVALMNHLAEARIAADHKAALAEVERILKSVYRDPEVPQSVKDFADQADQPPFVRSAREKYELDLARMRTYRITAVQLYDKLCDEFPNIADSGWAVINAVAEAEDHRRPTAANARSALFGEGAVAKDRAFVEVMKLVKA
jgi:hypothetical protein